MLLSRKENYECDLCGDQRENPQGWSTLAPMIGDTRTDFRSGVKHVCAKCAADIQKKIGK